MDNQFYYSLTQHLKTRDEQSANRVIMQELGNILIKDRDSFITLLQYADIPATTTYSDAELIESFIDNINTNRKLMIGAAFLINHKNQKMGFDGESEISDSGVKAVHKVMFNYFDAAAPRYSNAGGAIAGAIDSAAKLGSQLAQNQHQKKFGNQDLLLKKADAKQALVDSVLQQRVSQKQAQEKAAANKAKTKKILLITSISVLGLATVFTGIYFIRRKSK